MLAWCVKEPLLKFKLPAGKALKVCGFTVSSLALVAQLVKNPPAMQETWV